MAVEIGALRALLSLDSAAFEKGAKRAQASMNNLQRGLTQAAEKMSAVGRKLTTRVTLPLAGLATIAVKTSLSTVDAQAKMAQSLDTTVESMQALDRAAQLAGVPVSGLEQLSKDLTRRLSQAAEGAGPAADTLERLGLSAEELLSIPLDERISRINTAINDFVPAAERAAVAGRLFGEEGSIAASRLSADVIARANDEIRRFGVALSDVDAGKIEAANDAIGSIALVARGLANQVAVSLAPTFQRIAETIAEVAGRFSQLSPEMKRFVGIGVAVAAAMGPLAIGLGLVAAGLAAIASPIGVIILAFGAVAAAVAFVVVKWDEIIARFPILETTMTKIGGVFTAVWGGVQGVVEGAARIIKGAIDTIVGVLTGDLTLAVKGLTGIWTGWVEATDAAIGAVLGIIEAIVPGFKQAVADIIATVEALPGRLKQWGIDAIQAFVDGMRERWQALKESVMSIFSLDGAADSVAASSAEVGRSAAEGFAAGLRSAGASTEQELRDYIEGQVIEPAKDALETNSPSKVFMRIGRDLTDGLAIGIQQNTQTAVAAITQGVSDMEGALEGIGRGADMASSRFGDMVADVVTGARSIGDVLQDIGNQLIRAGINGLFGGGSGGGGLFGNLFAGLFDKGGRIGSGQFGIVGERGPEIVTGPANVTSRLDTARLAQSNSGGRIEVVARVENGSIVQDVREISGQVAVRVMSEGLSSYDKSTLPRSLDRIQKNPRRRG